jgi:small subunit ribosomal protein S27Ae
MLKREIYKVENDKLIRQRRFCPKCGPGVFLAEHEDRFTCGKCGYTEFKKKEKSPEKKPKQ